MLNGQCARLAFAGAVAFAVNGHSAVAQLSGLEAAAASLAGTWEIVMQPVRSDGQLTGCTLVYDALLQDWAYSQGALIKVSGNVGMMVSAGRLALVLKVVVNELSITDAGVTTSPIAPTRAYLVGADHQTNLQSLVDSGPSDTPGALFSIFQASPGWEMVLDATTTNRLQPF